MTQRTKHATLSEVAKKAGVGTTTVSRVINGGQNVDPKTLARVQRAIDSLGYMPSQAARILKGDRTRAIGLIVPSIADPFFSSCAEAAQAVVQANGSVLIVLTTQNSPQIELEAMNTLMRHRVDGLMIAPCNAEDDLLCRMLSRLSTPVVSLDRPIQGSTVPAVVADNFNGAKMATEHLIGHGYKRIACLTRDPHLYTIQERMRGYEAAMRAAGLEPEIESSFDDKVAAHQSLDNLLARRNAPEALFTLKNSSTIAAFEKMQRTGIAIPTKVALIGYDDFQLAGTVRPSISVIQQPIEEIGQVAAKLLFDLFHAKRSNATHVGSAQAQIVQLTTRLIRRASCGCPSVP